MMTEMINKIVGNIKYKYKSFILFAFLGSFLIFNSFFPEFSLLSEPIILSCFGSVVSSSSLYKNNYKYYFIQNYIQTSPFQLHEIKSNKTILPFYS